MAERMLKTILVLCCVFALPLRAAEPDWSASAREAHAMLTRLCDDFGGRLTGSPANRGALEQLARELRALGYEPEFDVFRFPGWERGADRVEVLAPFARPLRVAALSYTQPHPAFEADAVDLGGFEPSRPLGDLAGKVGVLSPGTALATREFVALAVERGLKALLLVNREGGGQLLARTGSFVGEPLPLPVYSITQEEGMWLQRRLARGGTVRLRIETASRCVAMESANLVLRLPGRSAERVVLGAHFDSWDLGQGAMDNGLGVAQVFAIAHALRGRELARTVEFVWFNGEEQGLWGSRHAAARLGDAPVVAMVNLDMVGPPTGVNATGDAGLVPVLERWHAARPKPLPQGVQNINWMGSDHTPYQLAGVRTVTFPGPIPRESVRFYHDLGDTIDKVPEALVVDSVPVIGDVVLALIAEESLRPDRRPAAEIEKLFTAYGLEKRMRSVGLWPFSAVNAQP